MAEASVLIVEDQPNWQELIKYLILPMGYQCDTVGSKNDAKNLLTKQIYKLAIVDIRLVEDDFFNQDGIEIICWLDSTNINTKVIVLSGWSTKEHTITALTTPRGVVIDYLIKESFDIDKFIEATKKVMNSGG